MAGKHQDSIKIKPVGSDMPGVTECQEKSPPIGGPNTCE